MILRYLLLLLVLLQIGTAHAAPGNKTFFVPDGIFRVYTSNVRAAINGYRTIDGQPTQFDMVMLAGAEYVLPIVNTDATGSPINITGYQYASQFRSTPGGSLFANYSATIASTTSGQIRLKLSAAQTTRLSGQSGFWDLLQIDNAGRRSYLLSGTAQVKVPVTP
jgi:hypothetical protein